MVLAWHERMPLNAILKFNLKTGQQKTGEYHERRKGQRILPRDLTLENQEKERDKQ